MLEMYFWCRECASKTRKVLGSAAGHNVCRGDTNNVKPWSSTFLTEWFVVLLCDTFSICSIQWVTGSRRLLRYQVRGLFFCVVHHKQRDRVTIIAANGGHRPKNKPILPILTLCNKNKVSGDWTKRRAETTTYSWYDWRPRWDLEGTAVRVVVPNLGRWCLRRELYGSGSAVCTKRHILGTAKGSLRGNLQRQRANQWGSKVLLDRKDCSG